MAHKHAKEMQALVEHLGKHQLKLTRQRELILNAFLRQPARETRTLRWIPILIRPGSDTMYRKTVPLRFRAVTGVGERPTANDLRTSENETITGLIVSRSP